MCGEYPPEVTAGVQYGPGVRALVTQLSVDHKMPLEQICYLFSDLYYSETVETAWEEGYELAAPAEAATIEQVKQAEGARGGGSGLRAGGGCPVHQPPGRTRPAPGQTQAEGRSGAPPVPRLFSHRPRSSGICPLAGDDLHLSQAGAQCLCDAAQPLRPSASLPTRRRVGSYPCGDRSFLALGEKNGHLGGKPGNSGPDDPVCGTSSSPQCVGPCRRRRAALPPPGSAA